MRTSSNIHEKEHPAGVRLLLGEHPPSHICQRGRMNAGEGGRYSRRTCVRLWRGCQRRKKKTKEQNELVISSRARPVTYLAGPPTSRVPPSYVAPIHQINSGPHPSEEGRGSQPQFQAEEKERRQRRRWWWETRVRNGNRSGVTQSDTQPTTTCPRPRCRPHPRSVTLHGV
jgi:hypothetical protein